MIGRSAEEVDHAPPRGRYAPVPAPQTVVPNSTLRWAAPAAALVVASAIVVAGRCAGALRTDTSTRADSVVRCLARRLGRSATAPVRPPSRVVP
ncbi:hypothetical protein FBY34_2332 [Streptomyces sp. SLBN-115]|nr:hypothetical protein FBY34_2332 [Streptomyces sp. SLBN-115]